MIKVLQSVSSLGIGGNEIFVMNLFRNIDKELFQVDFIIYDDRMDFADEVLAQGSTIHKCPQTSDNKIASFLKETKYVYSILKENHYDIIHCNGCSFVNILKAAIPAKIIGNSKVIAHAHSVGKTDKSIFEKIIYSILKFILSGIVDFGLSCSDTAGESKYTKKFLSSKKYMLINNAIDIEKYSYSDTLRKKIRQEFNLSDSTYLIGNVGRLSYEKNQQLLFNILFELRKEGYDAALILIGGGPLEAQLKEMACKIGVEDSVIFTGNVFDVEKYYSAMDVYVMTSLYEGLPFTVIEAQVNGLKCVLTNAITTTANVSGDCCFLSIEEDPKIWAEKILMNLTRSQSDKTQKVQDMYDIKKETLKIEKIYVS